MIMHLFQIVSNKYCEVDVDKWDYIMRDLYYLRDVDGVHVNQDSFGFFLRAQIRRDSKGVAHIAYRLEDKNHLRMFFETRRRLRQRVYMHPSISESEIAFCQIIRKATEFGFQFNGRTIYEASENPHDFLFLNDSIMNHLEIWIENNRSELPALYAEYAQFKSTINQFTNYLNYQSENEEEVQIKSPLFYSDTGVERLDLPY